jgi:tetratricopeptide (TPR) repeat protein
MRPVKSVASSSSSSAHKNNNVGVEQSSTGSRFQQQQQQQQQKRHHPSFPASTSVRKNSPPISPPAALTTSANQSRIPRYQPSSQSVVVSPDDLSWRSPTLPMSSSSSTRRHQDEGNNVNFNVRHAQFNQDDTESQVIHYTQSSSDFRSHKTPSIGSATPITNNCLTPKKGGDGTAAAAAKHVRSSPADKVTVTSNSQVSMTARTNSRNSPSINTRSSHHRIDKGNDGIQTKSCLTFRLPSSTAVSRGYHVNGNGKGDISSIPLTSHVQPTPKIGSVVRQQNRFGWITKRRNNNVGGSRATATSQGSSSAYPVEEEEGEDDPDFPPNSSWAEGSLSPTHSDGKDHKMSDGGDRIADNVRRLQSSINARANGTKTQITSSMTKHEMKDLFSPPPSQDRGSDRKRIQQYEQEKRSKKLQERRRGLYEGELEPEGVRGQEARIVSHRRSSGDSSSDGMTNPVISIRASTTDQSERQSRLRVISSVSTAELLQNNSSLASPSLSQQHSTDYDEGGVGKYDSGSNSSSVDSEERRSPQHHMVTPPSSFNARDRHARPPAHRTMISSTNSDVTANRGSYSRDIGLGSDGNKRSSGRGVALASDYSESTCSDENIQGMLKDLVPSSRENSTHIRSSDNNVPNLLRSSNARGQDRAILDRSVDSISNEDNDNPTDEIDYDEIEDDEVKERVAQDLAEQQALRNRPPSSSLHPHRVRASNDGTSKNTQHHILGNNPADIENDSSPDSRATTPSAVKSYDLTKSGVKRQTSDDKHSSTTTSTTTELSNDSPPTEVDTLNTLAVEHVNAGQYDDALRLFTSVLQLHQELHGANIAHPNTASAYHNLGTVHAKRAQALEAAALAGENTGIVSSDDQKQKQRQARASALQCFQAAARSARDSMGKNHPNVAVSLVRIGFLLLQSKQYSNADTTFSEALRIRLEHYGSEHSLVANLYNNLGVCRMHLGEFDNGLQALEDALQIQHSIVTKTRNSIMYETGVTAALADKNHLMTVHKLELADTLFNVGGLCLEWIRRSGEDMVDTDNRDRALRAYRAFEEALAMRLAAYNGDKNHPAVLQVQNLLQTAQQYLAQQQYESVSRQRLQQKATDAPFTRSAAMSPKKNERPSRSDTTGDQSETSVMNNADVQVTTPSYPTTPSQSPFRRKGISDLSPSRIISSHADTRINGFHETSNKLDETAVVGPPIVRRAIHNGSGDRDAPHLIRAMSKSPIQDVTHMPSSELPESVKEQSRTNVVEEIKEDNFDATSFRAHDKKLPTTGENVKQQYSLESKSSRKNSAPPPLAEVKITGDESDFEDIDKGTRNARSGDRTHIYMAPHPVPESSSTRRKHSPGGGRNISDDLVYNSVSLEMDHFSPDISTETNHGDDDRLLVHRPLLRGYAMKSWSYDGEENCLISNTGVDSDRGRIHYPMLRDQGSVGVEELDFGETSKRDIMLAQPFHMTEATNRSIQPISSIPTEGIQHPRTRSSISVDSNTWGSETVSFSTGNRERDDLMSRARMLLDTTNVVSSDDSESDDGDDELANRYEILADGNRRDGFDERSIAHISSSTSLEQDLLEDGVAPLCENGISTRHRSFRHKDVTDLLKDPMTCLPELHEEASKQLKNNNPVDAIHLFEIILRCQRRRYGALHPDVASALHNVGIAQLRVQNHDDALGAFEEAARVRKGSLGKDHPLVAVSFDPLYQPSHMKE